MPKTEIRIYQELDGVVPLLDWLDNLTDKARDKCVAVISRLADFGNQLRRPDCDYLTDGIYELRARVGNVNYRILYGFAGKQLVMLSHGCTKEKRLPEKEINKAIENLKKYKRCPQAHTYREYIL